jgi:hypothetical protein
MFPTFFTVFEAIELTDSNLVDITLISMGFTKDQTDKIQAKRKGNTTFDLYSFTHS